MGTQTYFYSRKTPDPSSQSYYVLEQWVCAILPWISLLWQHVSSLPVEKRQRTRELCLMASTTALKTLTGRRSSVVPLSTIALSMLYWKKGRQSEVQFLSSTGSYGSPWANKKAENKDYIPLQHCCSDSVSFLYCNLNIINSSRMNVVRPALPFCFKHKWYNY